MKGIKNMSENNTITNINLTTAADNGNDLSPEMKSFYDTALLTAARGELYHNQFGMKQALKGGRGEKVEWRRWHSFGKALKPLTEGVIPDGNKLNVSKVEANIQQYGDYTPISDRLEFAAVDNVLAEAAVEHGAQAGETLDAITRNELQSGTNVIYADKSDSTPVESRADITADCKLTDKLVAKAATSLKKMKTPTINGSYVAIIHPSVAEDLRMSQAWNEAHKYAAVKEIFNGEIGELHGVRFVQTTEAKVYAPAEIYAGFGRLTVATAVSSSTTAVIVSQSLIEENGAAYVPEIAIPVYVNGAANTVTKIEYNAAGAKLTLGTAVTSLSVGDMICGQGAGKDGSAVYGCLFLGRDAYGIVEPNGASLEMIIKPKDKIGGPLNQFSTVGWKASHAAKILYQERLIRLECGSSYSATDEEN